MLGEDELVDLFRVAPKESFELLLRNIKIREIFEDIYGKYKAGIKLSYNEDFDKIFEELFRFFFRPLEIAVFGSKQLELMFPLLDIVRLYENQSELLNAYREFMTAFYNHIRLTSELYLRYTGTEGGKDLIQKFADLYLERMRKRPGEFFEVNLLTETPFLLPKVAFDRLEKALESWNEFSLAFKRFREMMRETYVKGAEAFIKKANEEEFKSYQEFANAFFNEEAKAFDSLLKSEEYLRTQGTMLNCLMDYIYNFRTFFEEIIMNNPFNPFATISLMDKAFERIQELKRRIRELEKRIERLEGGENVG